jgi:hypothetical protein
MLKQKVLFLAGTPVKGVQKIVGKSGSASVRYPGGAWDTALANTIHHLLQ